MSFVVMRHTDDGGSQFYSLITETDSISDAVDSREACLIGSGGKVEIFQRVYTLEAYAEAARQRAKPAPELPPTYPAPDAAFKIKTPAEQVLENLQKVSRAARELEKFEAHEVKG